MRGVRVPDGQPEKRRVGGGGLNDAFVCILGVFFVVAAVATGEVVPGVIGAVLLALCVRWPSLRDGEARANEASRVIEEQLPGVLTGPSVVVVVALFAMAGVASVAGGVVLGPWGAVAAQWIWWVPVIAFVLRRKRKRMADGVVARSPSMTAEELARLLGALERKFGKTFVKPLRTRLVVRAWPTG